MLETMQAGIRENVEGSAWIETIREIVLREIFPNSERLKRAMGLLWFYQRSGLQKLIRKSGILKHFPDSLDQSEAILPEIKGLDQLKNSVYSGNGEIEKVGFLRGCVMDYFYPDTNRATINVLEKVGYTAEIPEDQGCCGAVHLHNGEHEIAKNLARKNIDAFEDHKVVISNAAGCGASMKEYCNLLADDNKYAERASKFSEKVLDISEFLHGKIDLSSMKDIELKAVFDIPCHLIHGQNVSSQPEELLKSIPGLDLKPLQESHICCGSGGTFNITQPEMSLEVLERKMNNIRKTGAEAAVTANIGCMIQLSRGSEIFGPDIKIYHIIDLLDIALLE